MGLCVGLNEDFPHGLRWLNPWFLVGSAVWGGQGDVTLLEEVHH